MKERLAQRCPVCFRATDTSICGECASLLADVVPEGIELMPLPDDCVSAELAGKIRRLIMIGTIRTASLRPALASVGSARTAI